MVKLQADGQWVDMPQMPTARSCAGAAVLGSDIYVVGGSPGVRGVDWDVPSSAVEKFDTMRNEWQAMPAMQVERTALAAAVIGNSIYVAGGMNHGRREGASVCPARRPYLTRTFTEVARGVLYLHLR